MNAVARARSFKPQFEFIKRVYKHFIIYVMLFLFEALKTVQCWDVLINVVFYLIKL